MTPGRLTKRPWTRTTAHGARFPCGRRATAERSPAQAPALRLAYCANVSRRHPDSCRGGWGRAGPDGTGGPSSGPRPTLVRRKVLKCSAVSSSGSSSAARQPSVPSSLPQTRRPPASQPLRPSTVIPQALGTTGSERAPGPADDNGDAEAGRGTRLPPSRACDTREHTGTARDTSRDSRGTWHADAAHPGSRCRPRLWALCEHARAHLCV